MSKVLTIAELGINHGGDFNLAVDMCNRAKAAGADIAKTQWYRPELVLEKNSPFVAEATMAQLTVRQHRALKSHCDQIGIEYCVSLFHADQVGITEDMGMKRYKIASRAALYGDLLYEVNLTRKPAVMSTGLLDHRGLIEALDMLKDCDVTLLYCVCKYPASEKDIDLKKMVQLKSFAKDVGFSSHCPSIAPTLAAVDMGGVATENHVCIDKKSGGCDIPSSITFTDLSDMIARIKEMEAESANSRSRK